MDRRIIRELISTRKWLLGGAAAVTIVLPLALATAGCASKGETHETGASNPRSPWFQTASIKLNSTPAAEFWASGNEFVSIEPAISMIEFAYGEQQGPLNPVQVVGGPDWINTEVFNIDAELPKSLSDQVKPPVRGVGSFSSYPAGVGRTDALKQVFRSLLINRFKLRIRHETKVLPVYELDLAKDGPKIAKDETADQPCRMTDIGPDPPSAFARGEGRRLDVNCDFNTFTGVLSAMPELRSRVLVNKTGLHGRYSFKLHWTPEVPTGMHTPTIGGQSKSNSAAGSEPSGPSLFSALQDQLGLEVKSTMAPVDTIVIQHIENPVKN